MANRNFPSSRLYSFHMMPVRIGGRITIGATGAVATSTGPGIAGVVRTGVGTYRIQLQDNYNSCLTVLTALTSPITGSPLDPNTGTTGLVYQITTVGNTNWVTAGLPAGITPQIGQAFTLAAAPAAGTGRVELVASSGIIAVETIGNPSLTINKQPFQAGQGGYVTIRCYGATSSSVTTPIATDPANGSALNYEIIMNNSSVQ